MDISILNFLNLNSKSLFDLKFDILILNYYFWFSKLVFQFKKINWVWKSTFWFQIFLFELEIWYLNSEVLNLNFKKLFDLKVETWIPNYYFGFSKLRFQFRKLLIES